MKKLMLAALFAVGSAVGIEAAPTDTVTQADLQAIIERLNKLEAENKAQAKKIAELEGKNAALAKRGAPAGAVVKDGKVVSVDEGAEVSESGKIVTTSNGKKYYLADAAANIFEPLSESGLQITPYGYLVFEGVWSDRPLDCDWSTDFVKNKSRQNNTTLSMQDSIMGIQFMTPEVYKGWKFSGKAEFDLAGGDQNSYDFHWRHLYVNAEHESGWSILFGQTWHLWKMVTPSEIDGAWLENAGHPYRRSPQIRVTRKWEWEDSSLEWRIGLVKGGPGMGGDRDDDGVQDNTASAWGIFETALVYDHDAAWDKGRRWLVGLGGMYGRDRSNRLSGYDANGDAIYHGTSDDYNTQMIMLAASIPFLEKFTLTGQFFAGENLGGVQAGCAQRVGFDHIGEKGEEVRTYGGFLDLAYQLNDTWSFALGYGMDNPSNSTARKADGILYNDRAYIAAFYQVLDNFKLGLEYARLVTRYAEDNGSHTDADANRVQFSAFYDF